MIQTDPAITAAIISGIIGLLSALVSALISVIGAILSSAYQSRQQELHENRTELQSWYNDVIRTSHQLRIATLDIDSKVELRFDGLEIDYDNSGSPIEGTKVHLDKLEELNSRPPDDAEEGSVTELITELTGRCKNPKGGQSPIESSIDFKQFVYDKTHSIEEVAPDEKEEFLAENRGSLEGLFRR